MSPWQKLLEHPHSGGHFVQLYSSDDSALVNNVGHYLWQGLRRGEGVLVVATADHQAALSQYMSKLGADIQRLLADGQLVTLDAHQTLASFMTAGQPDWNQFENAIRGAMRRLKGREGVAGSRAYGEMVGILWKARQFAAAIRLEQFWNKLMEQCAFSLYCAYAVDIFAQEFAPSNLDGVLCTHTHLIPAEPDGKLENALNRSMDDVLGTKAAELRALIGEKANPSWAVLPAAERTVLWLRKHLPAQAEDILTRARRYYLATESTLAG